MGFNLIESTTSRVANDHGHDHNSEVNFLMLYGRLIDYNRLFVSQEDLALEIEL